VQETGDPSAVLWYEEIQQTVDMANAHTDEAVNGKLLVIHRHLSYVLSVCHILQQHVTVSVEHGVCDIKVVL